MSEKHLPYTFITTCNLALTWNFNSPLIELEMNKYQQVIFPLKSLEK